MRFAYRSRRYTEAEFEESRAAAQELIEQPGEKLTAGQQLALLTLRKSDLSERLLQKLLRGTARPGAADYVALRDLGYAQRRANGLHAITPQGQWHADNLARQLAKELKVPLRTQMEQQRDTRWWREPARAGW